MHKLKDSKWARALHFRYKIACMPSDNSGRPACASEVYTDNSIHIHVVRSVPSMSAYRMTGYCKMQRRTQVSLIRGSKFLREFRLDQTTIFRQTELSKQRRTRWDAAERGVSSGSTLFVTHPVILDTLTSINMDLWIYYSYKLKVFPFARHPFQLQRWPYQAVNQQ